MIIEKKTITLEKIESGDHNLYSLMSLVADKLRAVYQLFGWTHMLATFGEADDTVEMLTMDCLKLVQERNERVTMSTGGLIVDCSIEDDDYINLDYSFNLG